MTIFSPVVTWIVEEGGGGLDLVEVERVVARHRAVQSGLEEGGPPFFLIVTISFLFVTIFFVCYNFFHLWSTGFGTCESLRRHSCKLEPLESRRSCRSSWTLLPPPCFENLNGLFRKHILSSFINCWISILFDNINLKLTWRRSRRVPHLLGSSQNQALKENFHEYYASEYYLQEFYVSEYYLLEHGKTES